MQKAGQAHHRLKRRNRCNIKVHSGLVHIRVHSLYVFFDWQVTFFYCHILINVGGRLLGYITLTIRDRHLDRLSLSLSLSCRD